MTLNVLLGHLSDYVSLIVNELLLCSPTALLHRAIDTIDKINGLCSRHRGRARLLRSSKRWQLRLLLGLGRCHLLLLLPSHHV